MAMVHPGEKLAAIDSWMLLTIVEKSKYLDSCIALTVYIGYNNINGGHHGHQIGNFCPFGHMLQHK